MWVVARGGIWRLAARSALVARQVTLGVDIRLVDSLMRSCELPAVSSYRGWLSRCRPALGFGCVEEPGVFPGGYFSPP